MSRPYKYTREQLQKIVKNYWRTKRGMNSPTITNFCIYAKIDKVTFYKWLEVDQFKDILEDVRLHVEDDLVNKALTRQYSDRMSIFCLKNWLPKDYKDKQEVTVENTSYSVTVDGVEHE